MQGFIIAGRHLNSHSKANCLKKRFNANILPQHIHRWQHHSKSTSKLVKEYYHYKRLYHTLLILMRLIKIERFLVSKSLKLNISSSNFSFRYNKIIHCNIICKLLKHRIQTLKLVQRTCVKNMFQQQNKFACP